MRTAAAFYYRADSSPCSVGRLQAATLNSSRQVPLVRVHDSDCSCDMNDAAVPQAYSSIIKAMKAAQPEPGKARAAPAVAATDRFPKRERAQPVMLYPSGEAASQKQAANKPRAQTVCVLASTPFPCCGRLSIPSRTIWTLLSSMCFMQSSKSGNMLPLSHSQRGCPSNFF